MLALVPLAVGTWFLVFAIEDDSWRIPNVAGTFVGLVLALKTWKRYVRWSVIRCTSTIGITLATLAQAALFMPLWSIGGCGLSDALCTAQSLAGLGVWILVCALLWWGAALFSRPGRASVGNVTRRFIMSPNAARLTIGIALIPLLPGVFFIVSFALLDLGPSAWEPEIRWCVSYALCALLALITWLLLWGWTVRWSRRRWLVTILLAGVLLASTTTVFLASTAGFNTPFDRAWGAFCHTAPLFAYALWLAGTAWAWRSDRWQVVPGISTPSGATAPASAAHGLALCPGCSYSLTGLREVRCPECGWASTVDDIVASSLARVLAVP